MSLFTALEIASSGMSAQRTRMNVASMNLANKSTTRTAEGGPYKRRDVVLEAVPIDERGFSRNLDAAIQRGDGKAFGVQVQQISQDQGEGQLTYDPGHPDADADGYVRYPDVSAVKEMVNMMGSARAYEAGISVMKTVKQMAERAMRIGK